MSRYRNAKRGLLPIWSRARRVNVYPALACAGLALAGCSGGLGGVYTGDFWVQPGKYEFLRCQDLAQRSVGLSNRERQLVGLMERANQEAAGPIVNAMVYSADLAQVRSDLALLQRTMQEKGCNSLAPAPKR